MKKKQYKPNNIVQFSRLVMSDFLQHHGGMPGLPVHEQCPDFTQNYVHWVSDAI